MLMTSALFLVLFAGTAILPERSGVAAKATPENGIFGWPLARITSPAGCGTTVTSRVQVPLFIVRTTTAWYGAQENARNLPTSTVYLPASTVLLTRTLYDVQTQYVTISPMFQSASTVIQTITKGSTETLYQYVPCSIIQATSTAFIPQFTFATVTATSVPRQTMASLLTASEVSSQVALVTRTEVVECPGQLTSLVMLTVTQTNMVYVTSTLTDVNIGRPSATLAALSEAPPVPQALPSAYLRF